ncbi:DUF6049 family protein [Nocardioides panacisoli]|uniref:DUF6049 family protein n=1 Tax=Nocardioides panacisoli TaxID=627624 RepID=A0ABP7J306_9ACTN
MVRLPSSRSLRAVLAGAGLLTTVLAAAPAHGDDDGATPYDAPLLMTIDRLDPGYVPDHGPVVISGTVTNRTTETWHSIDVYPFLDADGVPIESSGELADAADSDPTAVVGERMVGPDWPVSVSTRVGALRPGETATYTLTVPHADLPSTTPGVYWFGVHALGQSSDTPADDVADGRARTFLPYVGHTSADPVDVSVVVPLRRRVAYTAAGAVARPRVWQYVLSENGNLGRLLAFGQAALGQPVTWLVDPAVADAVKRLADGNPARSLAPTTGPGPGNGGGDGSQSASPSQDPGGSDAQTDQEPDRAVPGAQDWLDVLQAQLRIGDLLTLPYGDLDMSAAADHAPDLYKRARDHASVLDDWDVPGTPVIGSPSGYLDANAMLLANDDSVALVTDQMFGRREFPDGPPGATRFNGHRLAVVASGAGAGGPGPDPRIAPVALRQRLLSEAALRVLRGDTRPLVVTLPSTVDASGADEFWSGLDADWLHLTSLTDALAGRTERVDVSRLTYPDDQADYELDATVFDEAEGLMRDGTSLQRMLTANDTVASEVAGEALTATSYAARPAPSDATGRLIAARRWIAGRQAAVRLTGPRGVTLSSADGSFAVTLANRLRQPVTVQIQAETDSGIAVDVGDPVELGPKTRTTQVLDAHTSKVGVHQVRLMLTTTEGDQLGATTLVSIRSGQVGEIIWVIIGAGAGILFVAIGIRLARRIRRARSAS